MARRPKITRPKRGEVYLVSFDPTLGAEIQKTRPALIVQSDIANRYSPITESDQATQKLQVCWGSRAHYGADWQSTWRKQLRVCSPEMIPIYFRLAVPEGTFSAAEMHAALALTSDAKAFGRKLIEFAHQLRPDKTTRIGRIVWQLLRRLDEAQRFPVLHEAISKGKALATTVQEVMTFGQEHGKYGDREPPPEEDRFVSVPHLTNWNS
jgi:predicted KAP-like P-loop ATPase